MGRSAGRFGRRVVGAGETLRRDFWLRLFWQPTIRFRFRFVRRVCTTSRSVQLPGRECVDCIGYSGRVSTRAREFGERRPIALVWTTQPAGIVSDRIRPARQSQRGRLITEQPRKSERGRIQSHESSTRNKLSRAIRRPLNRVESWFVSSHRPVIKSRANVSPAGSGCQTKNRQFVKTTRLPAASG